MAEKAPRGRSNARSPRQAVAGQGLVGGAVAGLSTLALKEGVDPEYVALVAPVAQVGLTLLGKFFRNIFDEFGWSKYFA